MGYSLRGGKPETAQWFKENEKSITRVLDIGAGSGTYIKLIKEEFNICKDTEWVGIEAWKPYIDKFNLEGMYDTIINNDIRKVNWESLGKFSVAIAGDILEHMSKDEAIELVENILVYCDTLIISIPIIYMPQDEINGNPFEIHIKPDWSHDEVIETWGKYIKHHYRKSVKSKIAVYWLSK